MRDTVKLSDAGLRARLRWIEERLAVATAKDDRPVMRWLRVAQRDTIAEMVRRARAGARAAWWP